MKYAPRKSWRLIVAVVVAALVATLGIASASSASAATTTLRLGTSSSYVTTLQRALDNNVARSYFGHPGYTQFFGSATNAGLKTWESDNKARTGVRADGIIVVGSTEWTTLMRQVRSTAVKIDPRCLTGRVICASVQERKIRYYEYGKLLHTLDARYGRIGYETRSGNFLIFRKKVDVVSNIYHTPMPYSIFFSGGQAVHFSASFATVGWNFPGSFGCINIRDKATLIKIFTRVRPGIDRVVVYNKKVVS